MRPGSTSTDALALPTGGDAESPLAVQANGMASAASDPNAQLAHFVAETGQTIPQAFWAFLTASGAALQNGALVDQSPLFDWVAVTGFPIAPAFWVTVPVGGAPTAVMVQLFERRVLSYTPTNPAAFRVEMGNIGLHYFQYRYLSPDAPLIPVTVAPVPASEREIVKARRLAPRDRDADDHRRGAGPHRRARRPPDRMARPM